MLNNIYHMLDPVAFSVGPFSVRWYGLAYVAGFVCAALVLWRTAKRWHVRIDTDSLLTIMLCVIIGVIIGGRLGYVLVYGDGYYFAHPAEILAFNHGGMSFHGGLIGALLAGIVAAHYAYPVPNACRFGLHRRAYRAIFRSLRQFRQRRAVGCAYRRAMGRGVRRRCRHDAASSFSALRGAA